MCPAGSAQEAVTMHHSSCGLCTSSPSAEDSPPAVEGGPHTGQGSLKCPRVSEGHIRDAVIEARP